MYIPVHNSQVNMHFFLYDNDIEINWWALWSYVHLHVNNSLLLIMHQNEDTLLCFYPKATEQAKYQMTLYSLNTDVQPKVTN